MNAVPLATRRWKIGSRAGLAGIVAVVLALGTGCADIWGFADLTEGAGAPDATSDTGSVVDAGADAQGSDGPEGGADEGGSLCSAPGTILSCGGCNQACD